MQKSRKVEILNEEMKKCKKVEIQKFRSLLKLKNRKVESQNNIKF